MYVLCWSPFIFSQFSSHSNFNSLQQYHSIYISPFQQDWNSLSSPQSPYNLTSKSSHILFFAWNITLTSTCRFHSHRTLCLVLYYTFVGPTLNFTFFMKFSLHFPWILCTSFHVAKAFSASQLDNLLYFLITVTLCKFFDQYIFWYVELDFSTHLFSSFCHFLFLTIKKKLFILFYIGI